MKKLFFVVIILIVNGYNFSFQFQDKLEQANKLYQNEEYQKALEVYQEVFRSGYESAELYYNIGNCYYRKGEIGNAILFYEKALKLNPDDEDINYNLSIAKAHTVDKINEVPKMFLVEWWENLLSWFTLNQWSIITAIGYLITIIGFALYFLANTFSARKLGFYLGVAFLSFSILLGITLASKYNYENSVEYGILLEKSITAKQSPDENSTDAFLIHEGVKFSIEDEFENWVKIRLADGKVGWLPSNTFGKI